MMDQEVITKTRANSFFPVWVRKRELRQRLPIGHSDAFYKSLYSSISPCHTWGEEATLRKEHGGHFSLEFSQDGTLLVVGCERHSLLIFDSLSRKLIRTVHNAHTSCVTNVKFLDSRIFATGSIDGTIALWDIRNLKSRFQTLTGHSNTIGNMEFSQKSNLLITSGLDGYIYLWDWSQRPEIHKDTFRSHVVQQLRLNPDETKMIISTVSGYILIIHDLDLNTVCADLNEFFLDMVVSLRSNIIISSNRPRNRLEIVTDFPNTCESNVISALEIHPQGWSAISRSEAGGQEWVCVHDIQEKASFESEDAPPRGRGSDCPPCRQPDNAGRSKGLQISKVPCGLKGVVGGSELSGNDSGPELSLAALSLERGARERRSVSPADSARARSPPPGPESVPPDPFPSTSRRDMGTSSLPRANSSGLQFNVRNHKHFSRLTHYIREPVVSDWYIEHLGVSADGRLVCSPLDCGIRLLAFSSECSEQNVSWSGTEPSCFHELVRYASHSNIVVCTKFSPQHCLLVSGCLDGKLAWYQPVM